MYLLLPVMATAQSARPDLMGAMDWPKVKTRTDGISYGQTDKRPSVYGSDGAD